MKCCVYIKNAKRGRGRGQTLTLIKHCLGEGRSDREIDDGNSRVDAVLEQGLVGQPDSGNPREMRDNLLRLNHASKSKQMAKHVVLSIEDTTDPAARRAAARILRRMTFEFLKAYAPGCASLAFVHLDRAHPHCHLIIANSDGERAIHWTPKMIREMQSMTWLSRDLSTLVESGRKGHRRAYHNAYPLARLSLAAELAALPTAELEKISWVQRGSTRVFMYKNRRIRERTIIKERHKPYATKPIVGNAGEPSLTLTPPVVRRSAIIRTRDNGDVNTAGAAGSKRPRPDSTDEIAGAITSAAKELEKLRGERESGLVPPAIKLPTIK